MTDRDPASPPDTASTAGAQPPEHALDRVARWFEQMTPAALARIDECYAPGARFKDPFSEVHGIDAIRQVYAHMYATLESPRFVVHERVGEGTHGFLVWEMRFRFRNFRKGEDQVIRGVSHLRLSGDGRVADHRDYWDAAEELYEKLPGVGVLMRWLKRQASS